ncbi:MAG: hypothetical protein ACI4TM_03220 [Candidatus Cryptobacteroides sp.]
MDLFGQFISEHDGDDVSSLLLKGRTPEGIDLHLAAETILARRTIKDKLPSWYALPQLRYPAKLSAEQCSSTETASYKATIAASLLEGTGKRIADLTGGLGADSHAFSKIASEVMFNEMSPALADAARFNFREMGIGNITVRSSRVESAQSEHVMNGTAQSPKSLLSGFQANLIYLDPARRDGAGRKVFKLEECSPDILSLKDELLALSRFIMVKLSPMADLSLVAANMGKHCREIHVVESAGECKEILVLLDREWEGEYSIIVYANGNTLSFKPSQEKEAICRIADKEKVMNAKWLFEPGKALMKAGALNLPCSLFGTVKAGKSTHLHFFNSEEKAGQMMKFGKVFRIKGRAQFCNRSIKETASEYPGAGVSAKNLPITSDALAAKMKAASMKNSTKAAGNIHIFAFRSDSCGNLILTTERLNATLQV